MTKVDFVVNLHSKLQEVALLCEHSLQKGHTVTINCDSEATFETLNKTLWDYTDTSFLPHVTPHDTHAGVTPIHLYQDGDVVIQDDILINLAADVPLFFGRFRQLIEVVSEVEHDKQAARERWKFYRDRGYALRSTDKKQANN